MTTTTQQPTYVPSRPAKFRPFKTIQMLFDTFDRSVRAAQTMENLYSLTDEELARRGLKRQDLPEYIRQQYFS